MTSQEYLWLCLVTSMVSPTSAGLQTSYALAWQKVKLQKQQLVFATAVVTAQNIRAMQTKKKRSPKLLRKVLRNVDALPKVWLNPNQPLVKRKVVVVLKRLLNLHTVEPKDYKVSLVATQPKEKPKARFIAWTN